MNMGFAWRETFEHAWESGSVGSRNRRTPRLVGATQASFSVFRELMRRPGGGTVVVLAPRAAPPLGDDAVVIEALRDAS